MEQRETWKNREIQGISCSSISKISSPPTLLRPFRTWKYWSLIHKNRIIHTAKMKSSPDDTYKRAHGKLIDMFQLSCQTEEGACTWTHIKDGTMLFCVCLSSRDLFIFMVRVIHFHSYFCVSLSSFLSQGQGVLCTVSRRQLNASFSEGYYSSPSSWAWNQSWQSVQMHQFLY
jgi:hypothetical protein